MEHFIPTHWQKVIYRNYGMVKTKNLAEILHTDEKTVSEEAENLGLKKIKYNSDWVKKGFVTIIRNNWELIDNKSICTLIETDEKGLNSILMEYDFLNVKLGEKPVCESALYTTLTEKEKAETLIVKEFTESHIRERKVAPFDFFKGKDKAVFIEPENYFITDRFVSSYHAKYSGALLDDNLSDYLEEYLERLKDTGINGIWMQETLRNLANFPFDESYSPDYKIRVKNLRKLTERCKKYGINVYLYLNEPRSLPKSFFDKHPELKGQETEDKKGYCLCTSVKEVKNYIYNAVKSIGEEVPLLKGVMTITMSENPTHCYSRKWYGDDLGANVTTCANCKHRAPEEVVAEINNIMARALKDGNGKTKLIANLWSWSDFMFWSDERILHGIELLDKDIEVLCVSEFSKEFVLGGVKSRVIDYSISKVGPSEITKKMLSYAKEKGHKIWAKIQINNSWECSAVPYIPVYDLMTEHINNLKELGVTGLMMGWSLGGYPGGAMPLCNMACGKGKTDVEKWYKLTYGKNSDIVRESVNIFSNGFKEFPFSIESLYLGGQTLGAGNFWSLKEDNRISTMTCFAFDDYKSYTEPYGIKIYVNQYKKLTDKWKEGLKLIDDKMGNESFLEFKAVSMASYIHFKSAMLLAEFSYYKRDKKSNKDKLLSLVKEEFSLTEKLYQLICEDATIGFEMTNHYYYNDTRLLEKMLNLKEIYEELNS